ncbi:MAG: DUF1786 domain-containing protein [Deltaproteobacteria bacterium]|nr:DUF1786 domain-containing protein [Deltaproteobacteria bacterium]
MREPIIAIDVGTGTQDILLYDPEQPVENAVKLVLPSPTRIAAARVRAVTTQKKPLFLSGRVMGGGPVSRAIQEHIGAGLLVYSLEDPALTIHDNIERALALGVVIVDSRPDDEAVEVRLGDIDMDALADALKTFEVSLPRVTALALQDHGFSPDSSNRLTRFNQWRGFLEAGGKIEALLYLKPPEALTRMAAASKSVPGAYLMDTGAAALRGAILDDYAAERLEGGLLAVNTGNGHTVAALVRGDRVWGVYEHHTSLLDPERLADQMDRFAKGSLTHEEVFEQGGHGVAYSPDYHDLKPFEPVVVTGPRREIARGLGHPAAPYGEMMLSGCFGLVEAVREYLR